MQVKKEEFKKIIHIYDKILCSGLYDLLTDDSKKELDDACLAIMQVLKRNKESNKKAKEVMRKHREIDKNYGRKKNVIDR